MDRPKRKHVATGKKPPGGSRPGAGRPEGSFGVLPLGAVEAVKALNHRVPAGAPPEAAALANHALARIVAVLDERVHFTAAGHVLKAATLLREEVCGPMAQKLEHTGADGAALQIIVNTLPPEEG